MKSEDERFQQAKKGLEKMMRGSAIDINGRIVVPLDEAKIHARAYMTMAKRIGAESKLQALKEEVENLEGSRAGTNEYELGHTRALQDVLNLITNLEDND